MKILSLKKLKSNTFFVFALLALVSCKKEIETIGVDLINKTTITSADERVNIQANTQKVEKVLASGSGVSQFLFGVYSKNNFGTLQGDLVSQLQLPTTGSNYSYGKTPIIDSVLLTIPYQATAKEKHSNGKPQYQLDSILGNKEKSFKISVHELKTFLNTLDPEDPSKAKIYNSNKVFAKDDTPFYTGAFKANANDTVAYIKRYDADNKVYKTDTLKEEKAKPFISIPLNKALIQQKLITTAGSNHFATQTDFNSYFRGLYIAANALNTDNSHIISLNFSGAQMRIFYSHLVDESETQDLNGNGTKGEKDVRVAKTYSFALNGIKSNVYRRNNYDFSNTKRLYVQGAAGAMVLTDVFANLDISELRKNPKLITQANLVFYVDESLSSEELPEQLFIYDYENSEKLIDLIYTNKLKAIGGNLEKTDDEKPYRYVFKITRYFADLLKESSTETPPKLAIKVYNPTDIINAKSKSVLNYNWNPKAVTLHGTDSELTEKRPVLEINYSELKD